MEKSDLRLLVVDDEEAARYGIRRALEHGHPFVALMNNDAVADPKFGEVLAKPTVLDLLNHAIHWETVLGGADESIGTDGTTQPLFGIGAEQS